jgi:hypothetical protein
MEKLKQSVKNALTLLIRIWQMSLTWIAFGVLVVTSFIVAVLNFLATGDIQRAKAGMMRVFK